MANFNENQIAEIKSRVDLIDLISSYGIQVSRTGNVAKCKCPFHNEKTPSFSIDSNKGLYYCFGCGEAGDAIKFVEKQEGIDFPSAVRKLAEKCGIKLETYVSPIAKKRSRTYALMAELAQFYHRCLVVSKEAEVARKYVSARNLDAKTCEEYLIGYAPQNIYTIYRWANKYGYSESDLVEAGIVKKGEAGTMPYYYFGGRLIFTVKDKGGRVVAFSGRQLVEDKRSGKYVNSPETIIFKKGKTLFGFDKASSKIVKDKNREVIICEGQIDCIRLHVNGFGNAVASQGTAFTEDHAIMLKRVADTALLCFDDDDAGHKATHKTADLLIAQNIPVRVVSLPDGDDPDTYLQIKGADAFRGLVEESSESIVSFLGRTYKGKESNPESIDAQTRVSNILLNTIAKCPSPVLRATMMKEASAILGIERADIAEEIRGRVKDIMDSTIGQDQISEDVKDSIGKKQLESVDADKAFVSDTELSLIRFVMSHDDDEVLKKACRLLLPSYVFKSALCRDLMLEWTEHHDTFNRFIEGLSETDYRTFISAIHTIPRFNIEEITAAQCVFFFARQIWFEHIISLILLLRSEGREEFATEISELCNKLSQIPKLGRKSLISFIEAFDDKKYTDMLAHQKDEPHMKVA